jgi:predicted RNA binding protein YcfA (HicA-like mRNA interferase family)
LEVCKLFHPIGWMSIRTDGSHGEIFNIFIF